MLRCLVSTARLIVLSFCTSVLHTSLQYDSNDDGFISLDEFRRLCAEQGTELSGPEVQAAFDLLDVGGWGRCQLHACARRHRQPRNCGASRGGRRDLDGAQRRGGGGGGGQSGCVGCRGVPAPLTHALPWFATRPAAPAARPPADKSGALDFGEWVEWFLAKQRKYEWLGGAAPQQVEKAAAAGEGQ